MGLTLGFGQAHNGPFGGSLSGFPNFRDRAKCGEEVKTSPELVSLCTFLLFWGYLCFPLTRQKNIFFAGVLIPTKKHLGVLDFDPRPGHDLLPGHCAGGAFRPDGWLWLRGCSQLFKADLLTFWFSPFGLFLVGGPKRLTFYFQVLWARVFSHLSDERPHVWHGDTSISILNPGIRFSFQKTSRTSGETDPVIEKNDA